MHCIIVSFLLSLYLYILCEYAMRKASFYPNSTWYHNLPNFFSLSRHFFSLVAVMGDAPPPPPPLVNINSPFYLGTGDRPGDFITPTRLRHDNYDDWSSDIQMALEARRKFVFLDGTITAVVPPYTTADWTTVNAMLIS